jgi:cytochrome c peroxidase
VLFYDQRLSQNGTVACATCHQQEYGFSDPDVLSVGFEGGLTGRHSMSIVNARYYVSGKFFWDERAATLEEQVLMPFQDDVEMGLTLDELEQIVRDQTYYPILFADAFGDETINSERISRALAQFIRSIVSTSSRYDQARVEVDSPITDFPGFTQEENLGKRLFYLPQPLDNGNSSNCSGCHASEVFVGPIPAVNNGTTTSTNNGLDLMSTDDLGIFEATGNSLDIGKFKAPSLINIAVRPPYMHDGRFATLEQVIEHYSTGIKSHPTLTSPLANDNGEAGNFNFTDAEKDALLAFLNTLTDHALLSDERFSSPFK